MAGAGAKKQYRKRPAEDEEEEEEQLDEIEVVIRTRLEDVKFLQRQRERTRGIGADVLGAGQVGAEGKKEDGADEGDIQEHALQDTFAQETAVTVEDPNMLRFIDQEMAKRRGRDIMIDEDAQEKEAKKIEDDLYAMPEHLKVKKRTAEESSTQWTTGIAEVQLPIEYKLRNIEETEEAKKKLQQRRAFIGRGRSSASIPASYSADYFQRGREYSERLRRENPELFKDKDATGYRGAYAAGNDGVMPGAEGEHNRVQRRQAATDEIMLERFRKRERNRLRR